MLLQYTELAISSFQFVVDYRGNNAIVFSYDVGKIWWGDENCTYPLQCTIAWEKCRRGKASSAFNSSKMLDGIFCRSWCN